MIRYLKDNPVPAFDPDTIQTLCGALDMDFPTRFAGNPLKRRSSHSV
jgi:hypothetical protein